MTRKSPSEISQLKIQFNKNKDLANNQKQIENQIQKRQNAISELLMRMA